MYDHKRIGVFCCSPHKCDLVKNLIPIFKNVKQIDLDDPQTCEIIVACGIQDEINTQQNEKLRKLSESLVVWYHPLGLNSSFDWIELVRILILVKTNTEEFIVQENEQIRQDY